MTQLHSTVIVTYTNVSRTQTRMLFTVFQVKLYLVNWKSN